MKKLGLVSTFNTECGISTYSEHLAEYFKRGSVQVFANHLITSSDTGSCDLHPIKRCWERTGDFKELEEAILASDVDVVHIQHEFGLFQNHESFLRLLWALKDKNIKIYITLHTVFTEDIHNQKIRDYAKICTKIIVHCEPARKLLNLEDKCVIIPHGSVIVTPKPKAEARKHLNIDPDCFLALTFGFITPTKGALDNISAVIDLKPEFPDLQLLVVGMPMVYGKNYANLEYTLSLYRWLRRKNAWDTVDIRMKYVPEWEFDYYAGAADIAIENYYQTHYSTSGMSHLVMSYGLPSVSSRANILLDLNEERSVKFNINDLEGMKDGIFKLITNPELREQLSKNCLKYTEEVSWPNIAKRHLRMYEGEEV